VSEPLFEQYKAALRRGHMSALDGKLEEALDAYRDAARLVPERPLSFASQGNVLHRLDRWPEAAEAFDTALRVSPDDEPTLRARATARQERGMLSGAAADFERLAFVLDVAGRAPEAAEAFDTALRISPDDEPTLRARATARQERGMLSGAAADFERLAFVLDVAGRAPEAAEASKLANDLEANPARAALAERLGRAAAGTPTAAPDAVAPAALTLEDAELAELDEPDLPPPPRIVPETDAEVARHANTSDPAESWPALDMPSPPPPEMVGPPPDPEALLSEAAELYEAGDGAGAAEKMLAAAAVHRAAGRLDAALDVCFQLLAISPGDPGVHLAISNLQLDRGWTPLAREKIDLLVRLTSLTGDMQAEADAHGLAAERLRDEPVASAGRR
jgi:tetratricopeptide (TPR) repeat protein